MAIDAPFGRMITAMVTPFNKDGSVDWDGVAKLAQHLVDNGHDAIAVNGTTGEAPTTKSSEKIEIIKVVKSTVGSKIKVISGAGDNETEYSINQAKRTAEAGADAAGSLRLLRDGITDDGLRYQHTLAINQIEKHGISLAQALTASSILCNYPIIGFLNTSEKSGTLKRPAPVCHPPSG